MATTDWNITDTSGLVSVGTHSLYIATSGPPRTDPHQPVLLIFNGTTGTTTQWPAFVRAISPHIRTVNYDRASIGRSERSPTWPEPPSLDDINADLHALLQATNIQPPYILLGHSWGGMLAASFAATFPNPQDAVKGLIDLDGGAPTHYDSHESPHKDFTTDPGTPWSNPASQPFMSSLNLFEHMNPRQRTALTPDEYATLESQSQDLTHKENSAVEFKALQKSYLPFLHLSLLSPPSHPPTPPFLHNTPVCLVHADTHAQFQSLFDRHTAAYPALTTEPQRHAMRDLLSTWADRSFANQKQFLRLTDPADAHVVETPRGVGHNVMMMDVGSCVEAVRWVLGKIEEKEKEKKKVGLAS